MLRSTKYLLLIAAMLSPCANAAQATPKEAIALVEKGAQFLKAHGKDELIKQVNAKNPAFVQGELYMTVRDIKTGVILANPVNFAIVGKDLLGVPDSDGKPFRREILDLANSKGSGWVDYRFQNPTTKKVEAKSSYIMKVGDVTLEAGIYKP